MTKEQLSRRQFIKQAGLWLPAAALVVPQAARAGWFYAAGAAAETLQDVNTDITATYQKVGDQSGNMHIMTFLNGGNSWGGSRPYSGSKLGFYIRKIGAPTCQYRFLVRAHNGTNAPSTVIGAESAWALMSAVSTSVAWVELAAVIGTISAATSIWVGIQSDGVGTFSTNDCLQWATSAGATGYAFERLIKASADGSSWTNVSNVNMPFRIYSS